MLEFFMSILRLVLIAVCLFMLRAVSLDFFIVRRIAKAGGPNYLKNNLRKNNLENYIYFGFQNIIPRWLYLFNLGYTAVMAAVLLFMFIGLAFGMVWLMKFALWLFMYTAVVSLVSNLLYNIPPVRLVRKWCFFGLYGSALSGIILTVILWNICF